jgi:hypothetical protein
MFYMHKGSYWTQLQYWYHIPALFLSFLLKPAQFESPADSKEWKNPERAVQQPNPVALAMILLSFSLSGRE